MVLRSGLRQEVVHARPDATLSLVLVCCESNNWYFVNRIFLHERNQFLCCFNSVLGCHLEVHENDSSPFAATLQLFAFNIIDAFVSTCSLCALELEDAFYHHLLKVPIVVDVINNKHLWAALILHALKHLYIVLKACTLFRSFESGEAADVSLLLFSSFLTHVFRIHFWDDLLIFYFQALQVDLDAPLELVVELLRTTWGYGSAAQAMKFLEHSCIEVLVELFREPLHITFVRAWR